MDMLFPVEEDNSYTTSWVDVRNFPYFSMSVVSLQEDLLKEQVKLQLSNDRQFSGGLVVEPLLAASAENNNGAVKILSDAIDVPSGNGDKYNNRYSSRSIFARTKTCSIWLGKNGLYSFFKRKLTGLDVFLTLKNEKKKS